jgi:hypothetical protein
MVKKYNISIFFTIVGLSLIVIFLEHLYRVFFDRVSLDIYNSALILSIGGIILSHHIRLANEIFEYRFGCFTIVRGRFIDFYKIDSGWYFLGCGFYFNDIKNNEIKRFVIFPITINKVAEVTKIILERNPNLKIDYKICKKIKNKYNLDYSSNVV